MSRKSEKNNTNTDAVTGENQLDNQPVDAPEINHFANIVLQGKGKKLSPKTDNHVFFELAVNDEDNALYLRLSGNEGGGLHSKEWLNLQSILDLLDQQVDKPFKSTLVKPIFSGSSSNNTGFLCAVARGIGLIIQSGNSVFLHELAENYDERRAELLSLNTTEASASIEDGDSPA